MPDQPVRVGGVLGGGSGVARADGEHAARQSLEALLAPARLRADRNQRRDAEDEAQHRPHDRDRDRQRQDRAEREHERDFVFLAPPGQVDDAGIVRKPSQAQGGQRQRGEENQQANHLNSASKRRRCAESRLRAPAARPHGFGPPASCPTAASRIDCSAASAACRARASVSQSPAALTRGLRAAC